VPNGATAAIASARRFVVSASEVGWVRRSGGTGAEMATLGRDGARLFLRFELPLSTDAEVLEAYVLLERAPGRDADPGSLALHAERVTSAWDAASLSWARQPAFEPMDLPITRLPAEGRALARVDVRALVARWMRRHRDDFGVAILAEGDGAVGVGFALAPMSAPTDRVDPAFARAREAHPPRLEVYVK
jgi:hypothetical protein